MRTLRETEQMQFCLGIAERIAPLRGWPRQAEPGDWMLWLRECHAPTPDRMFSPRNK